MTRYGKRFRGKSKISNESAGSRQGITSFDAKKEKSPHFVGRKNRLLELFYRSRLNNWKRRHAKCQQDRRRNRMPNFHGDSSII